jgi:hypothetical protein
MAAGEMSARAVVGGRRGGFDPTMISNSPQKINFLVQRSLRFALDWHTRLLATIKSSDGTGTRTGHHKDRSFRRFRERGSTRVTSTRHVDGMAATHVA